jgi:hypothetical protein
MCELGSGFTTFAGPEEQVVSIAERFRHDFDAARLPGIESVHVNSLREFDHTHFDSTAPAVGVITHDPAVGHRLADQLHVELLTKAPAVLAEPGFRVQAAMTFSSAGGTPTVALEQAKVQVANQSIGRGMETSVAVIDSGTAKGATEMVDFSSGSPVMLPAADDNGHGTSVTELILALRPHARVKPVKVLNANGLADSFAVFLALAFCLWDSPYRPDIINASFTSQRSGPCANGSGKTMLHLLELCRMQGHRVPHIVAAAGNTPDATVLGYPAVLPTATVATALDFNGHDPGYNVPVVGTGVTAQSAFGGTETDPFGTLTDSAGGSEPIYGTSYAAAVVTASMLFA